MQTTLQQPGAQPANAIKKLSWRERRAEKKATKLAAKIAKAEAASQVQSATPHPTNFYERAIEWTHRADKVVNLILGYLLAVASVLGFMDVLSNGEVLSQVPWAFYVWLAIMGLGVDFQILLVIGRVPELARSLHGFYKLLFLSFNFAFLGFLAYMSVVIGAVFTEHRDMPVAAQNTIGAAMALLHIDSTNFVFQRAALATLLLVLMAVDRAMERWRMQIATPVQTIAPQVVDTSAPVQAIDIEKVLQAVVAMNQANLVQMQEMNNRSIQVSVSLIEETVNRLHATLSVSGGTGVKELPEGETPGQDTDELEAMALHTAQGQPVGSFERPSYKEDIEALLQKDPTLSDREIAERVTCSLKTAKRWRERFVQAVQA